MLTSEYHCYFTPLYPRSFLAIMYATVPPQQDIHGYGNANSLQ